MTTALMERGSYAADGGESWDERQDYLEAVLASMARTVIEQDLPMNEKHPFYGDWQSHVENQYPMGE